MCVMFMSIYIYIYMYIYIYIYIYVCVCVCVYIYIYICVCVCLCMYIYVSVYILITYKQPSRILETTDCEKKWIWVPIINEKERSMLSYGLKFYFWSQIIFKIQNSYKGKSMNPKPNCYVLTCWPGQKCHSRWCTGRKWHILMAVMRGNRVGRNWQMKWDEVKKNPIILS